ncbi:MAG: plasmid replication initiator TrfA [bacterium]|nr:plasmid replication initiator TrfA [bacterium]
MNHEKIVPNATTEITPQEGMDTNLIELSENDKSFAIGKVPHDKRVAPNIFLRSALFSLIALPSGKNELVDSDKDVFIPCQDGYEVSVRGHKLDQGDQDVYLECMAVALANINSKVTFSHREILGALDISVCGTAVQRLRDRLNKMVSTSLFLKRRENKTGRWRTYSGNLLNWSEDSGGNMSVQINMDFLVFLQSDFTAIDWQERLGINSALAKWMHGYYSSHKHPFPISVKKVHELSGSTNTKMYSFRGEINKSIKELAAIGFIEPETSGINKSDALVIERRKEKRPPGEPPISLKKIRKSTVKKAEASVNISDASVTGFDLLGDPILGECTENKKRLATGIYPQQFEDVWAIYPKRAGDNPKGAAYSQWNKRVQAGLNGDTPDTILNGVHRYIKFCQSTDKVGTEYVLQGQTFFGANRRFADEWKLPVKKEKSGVIDAHVGRQEFKLSEKGFL